MSITTDRSSVRVAGALVTVVGTSGIVSSTWAVEVDGVEVASQKVPDEATIEAPLPDGSIAEVHVQQRAFGPTKVTVHHQGILVGEFAGFVA